MSRSGLDTVIASTNDPAAAENFMKQGKAHEAEGKFFEALEAYKSAAQASRTAATLFKVARMQDYLGFDDEAMRTYEECTRLPNPPINAFLNLAVLLEDAAQFTRASKLIQKVIDANPNHPRARLFMRDVQASKNMLYDEELARLKGREEAMYDLPVAEFELSIRARNCLKKMNIRTLGDLLRISEAELLSYKNFGETSLVEIKQMLAARGLRLGQQLDRGHYDKVRGEVLEKIKGTVPDSVLNQSVGTLNLGIRSRKALQLLGIQTIGDLAARTEAELMGVKNFGATSLVEIHERLAEHGLSLRTLE
jgi:DNA-directed RNA polymerase subunit alpha